MQWLLWATPPPPPPKRVKSYACFGQKITYIQLWWWEGHSSKIKKLFIPSVTPRRRSWTRIKANIGRGIFSGFAVNSNLLQAGLLVLIFCRWKLSFIHFLSLSIYVHKMHISQPRHDCPKPGGRRGTSENTHPLAYIWIYLKHQFGTGMDFWKMRRSSLADLVRFAKTTVSPKTSMQITNPPTARSPSSSSKPLSQSPSISTPRCLSQCGSHKFLCKYSWFPGHNIPGSAGGGRCWCLPLLPCIHLVLRKDTLHFSGNFVAFFGGVILNKISKTTISIIIAFSYG